MSRRRSAHASRNRMLESDDTESEGDGTSASGPESSINEDVSNRNNRNNRNMNDSSDEDGSDVIFDEQKHELDSSSDTNQDCDDESDPTQSHPDFSLILPSVLNGFGNKTMDKFKHIEGALESIVDTAQSLAEHNGQTDSYQQQTERLKAVMHKLLNLGKQKKCEKMMFNRISRQIEQGTVDEDKYENLINDGDWNKYFEDARNDILNEIDEDQENESDAEAKQIKKWMRHSTASYQQQFNEAIHIDEIEDPDSNQNDERSESDDDIIIERSNKNANSGSIKCPLTMAVFDKPIKSKVCGHTFEKDAILRYINNASECPLPGCSNLLTRDQFIRDVAMERAVKAHRKQQQNEESDDDDAMFDLSMPNNN